MYSFRFSDIHLGVVHVQFNGQSSDDIHCVCNRVIINERNRNSRTCATEVSGKANNHLQEDQCTIQRDYVYDETETFDQTGSHEFPISVVNQQNDFVSTKATDTGTCDNADENDEITSSCQLCCFGRIFQILRKKFGRDRNKEETLQSNESNERDCSSEIVQTESICVDKGSTNSTAFESCQNVKTEFLFANDRAGMAEEGIDPIKNGLFRMGYMFDVDASEMKKPFQRLTLHYNETQIREVNKDLILCSKNLPFEDADFLKSGETEMEKQDPKNKRSVSPDSTQMSKRKRKEQGPRGNVKKSWPPEIEMNPTLQKYWYNRYRLFSKFDKGIQLDAESWYSVTPEKISMHIADRCRCDVIVDGFCGAGGNTIQFAFTCERVIAIDIDPKKIQIAKHNAAIYKVADRIEFIVGDFFKIAPHLKADVVFLSPPWGGPNYQAKDTIPLQNIMEPYGGKCLYETSKMISEHIAYYLPRNANVDEIIKLDGPGSKVELEQNVLGKKIVALTAYFGELVYDAEALE